MGVPDHFFTPPKWAAEDFPFKVSAKVAPDNSRLVITIDTPEGWAELLCSALEIQASLGDLIRRRINNARMLNRAAEKAEAVHAEDRLIYARYQDARKKGFKHREAVFMVSEDHDFGHLAAAGWTTTDFGRTVRAFIPAPPTTERPARK
jgi:hypothetical protein